MHQKTVLLGLAAILPQALSHQVAWHKGMYCLNGTTAGADDQNNNVPVAPLYNLTKSDWWFQHDRGCDAFPPAKGDSLEIPAGGTFEVEIAENRAFTTLSYDGENTGIWPNGENYPEDRHTSPHAEGEGCLLDEGALHTANRTMASGTAFAISYNSKLEDVTIDNLVVFSVKHHTPWHRIANYDVPSALPACPPGGCICAWLWVPSHCGQLNMYMSAYRCKVTGATSNVPLAKPKPAKYCEHNAHKCVKGAKQMIATYQLDGNNLVMDDDVFNQGGRPGYNKRCGFSEGAQEDIFQNS